MSVVVVMRADGVCICFGQSMSSVGARALVQVTVSAVAGWEKSRNRIIIGASASQHLTTNPKPIASPRDNPVSILSPL